MRRQELTLSKPDILCGGDREQVDLAVALFPMGGRIWKGLSLSVKSQILSPVSSSPLVFFTDCSGAALSPSCTLSALPFLSVFGNGTCFCLLPTDGCFIGHHGFEKAPFHWECRSDKTWKAKESVDVNECCEGSFSIENPPGLWLLFCLPSSLCVQVSHAAEYERCDHNSYPNVKINPFDFILKRLNFQDFFFLTFVPCGMKTMSEMQYFQ